MRYVLLVCILFSGLLLSVLPVYGKRGDSSDHCRVLEDTIPPANKNLLFYLTRTTNPNIVIYELNFNKNGDLNEDEPVHAYWIRKTEGDKIAELSYLQKKFAYGLQQKKLGEPQTFRLKFVSYEKKYLILKKSQEDKRFHVYLLIGNRELMVEKIYIRIEGGTFWFPRVPYVEVTGKYSVTGKMVKERFAP